MPLKIETGLSRLKAAFASVLPSNRDPNSLGARATQAGYWTFFGFGTQRALQFVSNLILTRLLFPEAFGLMALAQAFVTGLAMFSDVGIKPSIISNPKGNDLAFLNTAWTIQVIRGFALFAVSCVIAWPVAAIYKHPELFPLLCILGSTAAINGFASIRFATAERDMDLRPVVICQILGQIFSMIVLVFLAFRMGSVWALAIGNVVGAVLTTLIGHIGLKGHRHRLTLEPDAMAELFRYGRWIFLSTVVTFLGGEGLRAIQAGLMTIGEFGVLTIAYALSIIPADLSLRLSNVVGLAALSEVYRKSPDGLFNALHRFRKQLAAISFVMFAVTGLFARQIVELLYDSRYHGADSFLAILVIANAVASVGSGYFNVMLAAGKSGLYLLANMGTVFLRLAGVLIGNAVGGTTGMLAGIAIANLAGLVCIWIGAHRLKLLDIWLDAKILTGISILTGAMALLGSF